MMWRLYATSRYAHCLGLWCFSWQPKNVSLLQNICTRSWTNPFTHSRGFSRLRLSQVARCAVDRGPLVSCKVKCGCSCPVLCLSCVQGMCRDNFAITFTDSYEGFSLCCCSKNQCDWRLGISWAAALHWKGWGAGSLSTTAALQICTGGAWVYDSTWVQVTHQGSEQCPWGWICTLWSQTGTYWWLNTPGGVAQRWSSSWSKCVHISSVLECNCVQYCVECLHMQKVTVDIICLNLLHLPECTLLTSSDDKSVLK